MHKQVIIHSGYNLFLVAILDNIFFPYIKHIENHPFNETKHPAKEIAKLLQIINCDSTIQKALENAAKNYNIHRLTHIISEKKAITFSRQEHQLLTFHGIIANLLMLPKGGRIERGEVTDPAYFQGRNKAIALDSLEALGLTKKIDCFTTLPIRLIVLGAFAFRFCRRMDSVIEHIQSHPDNEISLIIADGDRPLSKNYKDWGFLMRKYPKYITQIKTLKNETEMVKFVVERYQEKFPNILPKKITFTGTPSPTSGLRARTDNVAADLKLYQNENLPLTTIIVSNAPYTIYQWLTFYLEKEIPSLRMIGAAAETDCAFLDYYDALGHALQLTALAIIYNNHRGRLSLSELKAITRQYSEALTDPGNSMIRQCYQEYLATTLRNK